MPTHIPVEIGFSNQVGDDSLADFTTWQVLLVSSSFGFTQPGLGFLSKGERTVCIGIARDELPKAAKVCGHLSTFERLEHLMKKPVG